MPPSPLPLFPSFLPVPSALVTFRAAGGGRRVHAVGWLAVVCGASPLLSVWYRPGADERDRLRAGDPFVVSLPGEELLRTLAGLPPLSFVVGAERAGPLVADRPVRMECRCRSLTVRFGQYRLCGEILAVHLDGQRHELAAPVDFCRLAPFQRRRFQGPAAGREPRGGS
jgi:flavin reductase (DIM6/NTAB) family NADH-FMN oxidoreductase RutF